MKSRVLALAAAASAVTVALAGCGDSGAAAEGSDSGPATVGSKDTSAPLYKDLPSSVKDAGQIVVGSQLSSPPIVFLQDDGTTVDGLNVKLAEALSTQVGVPFHFSQVSFASLTPSLKSGKIDIAFDMMSDTKERQQTFDFVDFIHNGLTYLVKKGNPEHIQSLGDLCGKTVSGVRGTSLVTYAEAMSKKECDANGKKPITVQQFGSASDARLQVQNGKNAAFLGQTPIMLYLAKEANGGNAFDAVIDRAYPEETIGIAVDKGNKELAQTLQKALQQLMDNGKYAKVVKEYGLAELAMKKATINAG